LAVLLPPRLDGGLRAHHVFVDAPLARRPLQNFVGGTGVIASHALKQRIREVRAECLRAARRVVGRVLPLVLGDGAHRGGAGGVGGGGGGRGRPGGKSGEGAGGFFGATTPAAPAAPATAATAATAATCRVVAASAELIATGGIDTGGEGNRETARQECGD